MEIAIAWCYKTFTDASSLLEHKREPIVPIIFGRSSRAMAVVARSQYFYMVFFCRGVFKAPSAKSGQKGIYFVLSCNSIQSFEEINGWVLYLRACKTIHILIQENSSRIFHNFLFLSKLFVRRVESENFQTQSDAVIWRVHPHFHMPQTYWSKQAMTTTTGQWNYRKVVMIIITKYAKRCKRSSANKWVSESESEWTERTLSRGE